MHQCGANSDEQKKQNAMNKIADGRCVCLAPFSCPSNMSIQNAIGIDIECCGALFTTPTYPAPVVNIGAKAAICGSVGVAVPFLDLRDLPDLPDLLAGTWAAGCPIRGSSEITGGP